MKSPVQKYEKKNQQTQILFDDYLVNTFLK